MKKATLYVNGIMRADVCAADNFFLRLRGLIGRDIDTTVGLLLQPCAEIHTMFMNAPIDVIYLDRDNCVLRIDKAVRPWRFCKRQPCAYSVLELSAGKAEEFGIEKGCGISFR